MDIKALQLESRFSLPPNSLGYCGKNTAAEKFKHCIRTGECKDVEEEVTHFIVLHPYLKLLADITYKPKFSYQIIEAYWTGNELLKKAKPEHYDALMNYFLEQGVPDFFVDELRHKQPKIFIPNHLFQVLHVGVGRASGAVPFNIHTINNCMIRWGKVVTLENNKANIILNSLDQINENAKISKIKYKISKNKELIPFNYDLVPNLKIGDTVAVHWNMVIKILAKEEENKLEYWTKAVIDNFD